MQTKVCEICGTEYKPKRSNQKYCRSRDCLLAADNQRKKRDWEAKIKPKRQEQQEERKAESFVGVDQGYRNLALAVLKQAVVEQDYDWVSEFGREFCRFAGHQLNNEQYRVFILEVYREHAQEK